MVNDDQGKTQDEYEDLYEEIQSSNGMSLARMREIEEADKAGKPLDLSGEERAQYEESKEELSKVMASLRVQMNKAFEPINKTLKGIIAHSYGAGANELVAPRVNSLPQAPGSSSAMDGIAEVMSERQQREEDNAANIAATAIAMQDLLQEIQADGRTQTKRFRWTIAIAAFTLFAAAIAAGPPIIDWLNSLTG